ncbi:MAG TPA: hypothetical protein VMW27_12330 [Thermoanaerobaculia bacterium]|nr:hypothetical protein [Thermoanaerobaculia bacterium]
MFILAESVEDNVWKNMAGIFATEEAARSFQASLDARWSDYNLFSVDYPDAYPFFLTGEGLEVPCVRPIPEDELERLLAEVLPSTGEEDWTILFNVYAVLKDSVNEAFPGEPVLPKIGHYHVRRDNHDFHTIRSYLLRLNRQ